MTYDGYPVDVAEGRQEPFIYNKDELLSTQLDEWHEKCDVAVEPPEQVERRRKNEKFTEADLLRLAGQLEKAEEQGWRFERYARCGVGEHRHRWAVTSWICQVWTYFT